MSQLHIRTVPMAALLALSLVGAACAGAGSARTGGDVEISAAMTDAHRWRAPLTQQGGNPAAVACRPDQVWDKGLRSASKALAMETLAAMAASGVATTGPESQKLLEQVEDVAMWALVRRLLLGGRHHNFGGIPIRGLLTADGEPVVVYRTGVTETPDQPGSCVQSLLRHGKVRHIVNLYAGPMPTADLETAERQAVQGIGGTYFLARGNDPEIAEWREHLRERGEEVRDEVSQIVAKIINEEILHPGDAPPRGNVHLHCGGGMHRTGMIMGILDHCINRTEPTVIEADYRRHVAWRSDESPGGFEAENLDFIFHFDCGLLDIADSPTVRMISTPN
jgi:hypothetical protein